MTTQKYLYQSYGGWEDESRFTTYSGNTGDGDAGLSASVTTTAADATRRIQQPRAIRRRSRANPERHTPVQ